MEKKDIGTIMKEIKGLINDAGAQGYKIEHIFVPNWIDASTCSDAAFFIKNNQVQFDIKDCT